MRTRLAYAIAAIGMAASSGQGPSNPVGVLGPTKARRRVTHGVRLPDNRPRGPACPHHGVALKRVRGRLLVGGPKQKVWICPRCVGWGKR